MVKIKASQQSRRKHGKSPGRGAQKRPGKGRRPADGGPNPWLYGHHAVTAALGNPDRRTERLLATAKTAEQLTRDWPDAHPEIVERTEIDAVLPPEAVHQGLALLAPPLEQPPLEDVTDAAAGRDALIVILDRVTDPQNVGAVLRSAAAFGATAVVLPDRHAPPPTGALAKAASGALEHVPLIPVANLRRTLKLLKGRDFWCLGLDGAATQSLAEAAPGGRIALVLGAEGAGLRRLTAERCDLLCRLPTRGPIATLNVSNAAAVALYELTRRGPDH